MSLASRTIIVYVVLIALALLALTTWFGLVVFAFVGYLAYSQRALTWAERLARRTMRNQRRAQHPVLVRWEDR